MMMKFDSSNVKLYMTIIQVYNNTLNDNATIYITINSVYGDINSHANGINKQHSVESQLFGAAFMLPELLFIYHHKLK